MDPIRDAFESWSGGTKAVSDNSPFGQFASPDDEQMIQNLPGIACHLLQPDEDDVVPFDMITHQLTPTTPGMKYVCTVCRKEFYDKTKYRIHYMIHTGEKPYSCPLCSYRSNRKASVKTHITLKHS